MGGINLDGAENIKVYSCALNSIKARKQNIGVSLVIYHK